MCSENRWEGLTWASYKFYFYASHCNLKNKSGILIYLYICSLGVWWAWSHCWDTDQFFFYWPSVISRYGHNKRSCHPEKTFWATKHSPPKQDISHWFLKLCLVAEPNIKTYDMWNYFHICPLVEGSLGNFSWSFLTNSFSFQMAELKELCETV